MTPLVVVRAVHYVSIAQVLGALVFAAAIAPVLAERSSIDRVTVPLRVMTRAAITAALLSWLAWLVLQAADMAGVSVAEATRPGTLQAVLLDTGFGHVWLARFVLLAALMTVIVILGPYRRRGSRAATAALTVVAAVAMGSLAGAGHAAAHPPLERGVHVTVDALHAIAAGAWLGALLPFALAVPAVPAGPQRFALSRRFSLIGIAAVAVLVASGVVNSLFLVGSWPALFGTRYGELILLKLALFAGMLALAGANRAHWTPMLQAQRGSGAAALHLSRNARVEAVLGALVLVVAAALGVSVPGAHDQVRWPFTFRLSFDGWVPTFIPAYPSTYAHSPVPYTARAVADGSMVFEQQCARCHGVTGRGNGPDAAQLTPPPADLSSAHVLTHPDGDLFWWISQGIAGTAMPPFVDRLPPSSRWELVQFIKTLAGAGMFSANRATGSIPAPAFAYQIDSNAQRQVPDPSQTSAVLVVLAGNAAVAARLDYLAARASALDQAGLPVVLITSSPNTAHDSRWPAITASTSPSVLEAYRLLAQSPEFADEAEFLIDARGLVRMRWRYPMVASAEELLQFIPTLQSERITAPSHMGHSH